ncbi:MAG: PGF-pre-PGF domain-containing protein, partial [Methanosarcinaceae archaeon]
AKSTTSDSIVLDSWDINKIIKRELLNNGGLFNCNVTLEAPNQPPVADPNGPYTGVEGTEIAFDGSASSDTDGNIVSYNWDFGDGNSATGVNPVHTYARNGTYTINLTVTDNDGATDTATTIVIVGNIAPTVTIHSPASITNDSTPLLYATFDQPAASIWYVIDGAAGIGGSNTDNLTVTLLQLADGQHTVRVYVNNSDGNVGSATQDFLVDTTASALTIDQVTSPTNISSQTISGTFTESGSDIDSITVNGVEATTSDSTYSATIGLTEGTNPVDVIAIDNAGNSGSNSTIIVLDTIAPIVIIDQVTSPTNISSQTISGTFTESGSGIDLITVNGINADISGSNSTNIILDITAPEVSITKPKANQNKIKFVNNLIRGAVNNDNLNNAILIVKNNNDTIVSSYNLSIKANKFTQRVQFAPDQNNTLELFAIDTAGNINIINRTVYVETNKREEMHNVNKSKPVEIDATNETGTAIEFLPNVTANNITFTMTAITNQTWIRGLNDSASMDNEIAVGKIVNISVIGLDATNNSDVRYVIIKFNYTKNDLDLDGDGTIEPGEFDENNMFIYWLNNTSGWTKLLKDNPDWVLDNGQVKISGNDSGYIWVKVRHLSTFGLVASLETELPDDGDGNNGGDGDDQVVHYNSGSSVGVSRGSSGEAYDNIALKEFIRKYIGVDTTVKYQFEKDGNGIEYITFDAKTNAGYVVATIEVLEDTSALVSSVPSGEIYQQINVLVGSSGYATERNIANPVIGFKVARSWIVANNIDVSKIRLNRYSDENWNPLATNLIKEDADYLHFESVTPGFSPFAITAEEKKDETDGENVVTEPAFGVETTEATPEQALPDEMSNIPGFGLLSGLSIVLITMQILRKNR